MLQVKVNILGHSIRGGQIGQMRILITFPQYQITVPESLMKSPLTMSHTIQIRLW